MKEGDWRDPKNYDYTKNHSNKMWAWEFLRRNPDYKSYYRETLVEYEKICSQLKDLGLTNNKKPQYNSLSGLFGLGGNKQMRFNSPLTAATTKITRNIMDNTNPLVQYNQLLESLYSSEILVLDVNDTLGLNSAIIKTSAADLWGLPFVYNPDSDEPGQFKYIYDIEILNHHEIKQAYLGANEMAIKIVLTKPISKQLKEYSPKLLKIQKDGNYKVSKPKKRGETVMQDYLRILDADAEGRKTKVAAPIIFPNKNNDVEHYNSCLKNAKKLMNGDYRKWL